MRPETIAILTKLSKGKAALKEAELLAFHTDMKLASIEDVRSAMYRPKATKPKAPVPPWLSELESARKRIKWTAAEATRTLVQTALDGSLVPADPYAGKKTPAFAVAAKKLATLSNGEQLASMFVREAARIEREHALG